jgi:hypothetical protein
VCVFFSFYSKVRIIPNEVYGSNIEVTDIESNEKKSLPNSLAAEIENRSLGPEKTAFKHHKVVAWT